MILNAIAERLKRRSKHDFKGRHFEATLIVQAVTWCLRYPLSYRDIEELFLGYRQLGRLWSRQGRRGPATRTPMPEQPRR